MSSEPHLPPSPRNPWTKAQRALSLARSGRHIAAQRVAEQMRYHPGVSTQMFRLVQQKLADAARIGRAAPRVDIPADYLGALDLGFRAPFRKVVAGVKPPQPYPAGMALPQLVGVKNEHKFLADAAIVLAARAAHRMRRTEVILCVDPTTDVGAVIGALMRQTYTGDIRLTVLTDTPGTLPDVPDRLSPRIVGAPIQSKTGMAAVQAILDRETSENDDPLVVMLSGCAILDPTALDRAVFSARVSDRLFQPLLARTGTGPLETGFNTTKRRHKLFSGRYPFRDMQGLNFAASAGLMRDIGLPDTRLSNPTLAGRELAFRAFVRGAYFTPLQITHIAHHSADTASPEEAALYGTLTPNPWDRKVDGRYEVPRVTIYIPAYNAERYICDAVNSVLDQDVQDLEICICNDGSLDATADLLETQYGDEPRVHWTNSRNGGIGYGSNTAIRLGRAPYIGQVDSDDRLKPGAVRRLMTYLDENPETACVYGSCERIDADGAYIKDEYRWPQFSRHKMMVTSITHHFRMFRRSAWERSGYFREDIVNAIDYDIFLKMSETGPFHHIDEVLYQRRWHGENTSSVNEGFQTTNTHRVQTEALKRLGLDRFWELHIPDPKVPRRITYRRRPDTRTVLFWPDYSRVNPYQHMLYGDAKQRMEICAGDIDAALATLRTMDDPSHLTFHLHWINMVMRGASDPTEADAKVDAFLAKVGQFISAGGRFVWTIHNTISHDTPFYDAEIRLSEGLAAQAHALHFHSAGSVDEVEACFDIDRRKVQIAQHGHYIGVYPDFVDRATARAELGLDDDEEVILFSGQVRPYKGVDHLITVFRRILAQRPRARLLIVGEAKTDPFADLTPALSPQEAARILSTGRFATDMELQLFFHAADIAVYPYQKILTSGSLMLALSYGLPAVVPDVAMTAQVVADSPAGRLYRPEDGLHALEKATLGLLDDVLNTPDRKALRHAVRARAKDFPWQPLDAVLLSSPKEPPV